jgi:hypothetical protein
VGVLARPLLLGSPLVDEPGFLSNGEGERGCLGGWVLGRVPGGGFRNSSLCGILITCAVAADTTMQCWLSAGEWKIAKGANSTRC